MKRLSPYIFICMLAFTFSCESDLAFDEDNSADMIAGEWEVVSVESVSYSSTMVSPNGTTDTSVGSFQGTDVNMSLVFDDNGSFSTTGDYNQILSIESPLPQPIMIEARTNDFAGGGSYEVNSDVLSIRTIEDEVFNNATFNIFTDTEMDFNYAYSRTLIEGTVTRVLDVEVNYVLQKQ